MAQLDTTQLSVTEQLGEHAANPPLPAVADFILSAFGRQWPIALLEQRIKAQFETWLLKNAMQAIMDIEAFANDAGSVKERTKWLEEAERQRSLYMHGRAAQKYSWRGEAWRAAMSDIPGNTYFLYLLLKRCDPGMTLEATKQIFKDNPKQCGEAISWALGNDVAPFVGAVNKDAGKD